MASGGDGGWMWYGWMWMWWVDVEAFFFFLLYCCFWLLWIWLVAAMVGGCSGCGMGGLMWWVAVLG